MRKKIYYLFAKEDIYDEYSKNVIYMKDELIGNLSMVKETYGELPRGEYYISNEKDKMNVMIEEKLESIEYYENILLLQQYITIHIKVIDSVQKEDISLVHIGLFAKEDIYDRCHQLVYHKNDLVFDTNKKVMQVPLQNINKGTFYIQQLDVLDGYLPNTETYDIEVNFSNSMNDFVVTLENRPIILVINKFDEDEKYLKGVWLAVFEENGDLVDEWISEKEHYLYHLSTQKSYVIKELKVPTGYEKCDDIFFRVKDDRNISVINIYNRKLVMN